MVQSKDRQSILPGWRSTLFPTKPRLKSILADAAMLVGILAILTLLYHGQIAATVLIMLPLVLIAFGKDRD